MIQLRVSLPPIAGQVMIVHDIPFLRNHVRQILLGAGLRQFVEPEPGGDAYTKLVRNPDSFRLIIDDHDCNPSGLVLLKMLREDPATPEALRNIPFIMLMSDTNPKTINEVMKAGASGIMLKPFNGVTLLKTIKRVMEKELSSY